MESFIYPVVLEEKDSDKQKKLIHTCGPGAAKPGLLKGVELTNFIQRSVDLINKEFYYFKAYGVLMWRMWNCEYEGM